MLSGSVGSNVIEAGSDTRRARTFVGNATDVEGSASDICLSEVHQQLLVPLND